MIKKILRLLYNKVRRVLEVKKRTQKQPFKVSELAHKYLDGLNGIEIGGSTQNPFGLDKTGAYANVDFEVTQGGKWQDSDFQPKQVNIVASGDNLPFKDETLDYVISSHVIEHFFDPVKAIKEWLRVVKKGGYIFIIVPHKDRTFDRNRKIKPLKELIDRHIGKLKITDYAYLNKEEFNKIKDNENSYIEYCVLIKEEKPKKGYTRYKEDNHTHWNVWRTEDFLEMCKHFKFNVVEYQDKDDKVGNGFTVVIKK